MSALFWGFFFVYINFNLIVNGHVLNVLPAFVGYALIMKACREMEGESGLFSSIRPFALGMAVYTGICGWGTCWPSRGRAAGWQRCWALYPWQCRCTSPGRWFRPSGMWRPAGARS